MIRRLLLCCLILPLAALAQIQVFQFDGTTETPIGALVDLGSASPGDTVETRFHVRNVGAGPVVLQTLSITGLGFNIATASSLPYTIAPGQVVEFRVVFHPTSLGTYNAFLLVNTINIALRGTSAPSAALTVGEGTTPLGAGAVIDFGSVMIGSGQLQILKLTNSNNASLTVKTLAVSGAGFTGPIGAAAPIQLAPGQSVSFQVAFKPQTGQAVQGTLTVDQRSFVLTGQGSAQIKVSLFDGTNETQVVPGSLLNIGSAAPGDTIPTRFRVRNIGAGPVNISQPSVTGGNWFTLAPGSGPWPYILAPGSPVDFEIDFQPTIIASYPASVTVDNFNFTIQGIGIAAAGLAVGGDNTPLPAGAVIDFGSVLVGNSQVKNFKLTNLNNATITVVVLLVSGDAGFSGPIGTAAPIQLPIQLTPGQSVSFQVAFEPQSGQAVHGALTVDQRSFVLKGQGLEPPLPTASIQFGSTAGVSAQQNNVSIPLAASSLVSGSGTLTMTFQPSVAGVTDDAAVEFVSGARSATVTISPHDTTAWFGSQSSIAFQTGSTAGTIVFTLTFPNTPPQQNSLTIAPAPINLDIDRVSAVRRLHNLDVSIITLDNTYSASQLAFTFYDIKGATIAPGVISVDATSNFHQYFFPSRPVGGQFALLTTFPVAGDVNVIAAFDVQITNSVGTTKSLRTYF